MSDEQKLALKELEYQLVLMVGEAEVRIFSIHRALDGIHGDGIPEWMVESSARRLNTQLSVHEEDLALHRRNLAQVQAELQHG